jgi:hypothetical protein
MIIKTAGGWQEMGMFVPRTDGIFAVDSYSEWKAKRDEAMLRHACEVIFSKAHPVGYEPSESSDWHKTSTSCPFHA